MTRALVRDKGWKLVEKVAPTAGAAVRQVPQLRRRVRELERSNARMAQQMTELKRENLHMRGRLEVLETDIQETRKLGKRIADLTEIVSQVLLPAANRDDTKVRAKLDDYARTLDAEPF